MLARLIGWLFFHVSQYHRQQRSKQNHQNQSLKYCYIASPPFLKGSEPPPRKALLYNSYFTRHTSQLNSPYCVFSISDSFSLKINPSGKHQCIYSLVTYTSDLQFTCFSDPPYHHFKNVCLFHA